MTTARKLELAGTVLILLGMGGRMVHANLICGIVMPIVGFFVFLAGRFME